MGEDQQDIEVPSNGNDDDDDDDDFVPKENFLAVRSYRNLIEKSITVKTRFVLVLFVAFSTIALTATLNNGDKKADDDFAVNLANGDVLLTFAISLALALIVLLLSSASKSLEVLLESGSPKPIIEIFELEKYEARLARSKDGVAFWMMILSLMLFAVGCIELILTAKHYSTDELLLNGVTAIFLICIPAVLFLIHNLHRLYKTPKIKNAPATKIIPKVKATIMTYLGKEGD